MAMGASASLHAEAGAAGLESGLAQREKMVRAAVSSDAARADAARADAARADQSQRALMQRSLVLSALMQNARGSCVDGCSVRMQRAVAVRAPMLGALSGAERARMQSARIAVPTQCSACAFVVCARDR